MSIRELKYWVAFSRFTKFGPVRFKKIISHFSSAEEAFWANREEYLRSGIEEGLVCEFLNTRKNINPQKEWELLEKEGIRVLTARDADYPGLLREIYDPPPLLYYKGNLAESNKKDAIAVVGTRRISSYGRQVTPKIVGDLAESGIIIVSGLALGVDALAHETALRKNGCTIAVLGSGLDKTSIYPSSNRYLAEKIVAAGGAIISEFPTGTRAFKSNFPFRNRIISGLSLGVVVIEAASVSGSLITARAALEQNREVFALPGDITREVSCGTNNLIKMGAHPITSAFDILALLNLTNAAAFNENKKIIPDTPEEEKILEILDSGTVHIDEIVLTSGLDIKTVSSTLSLMEMKGKVRNLGGMNYVLAR